MEIGAKAFLRQLENLVERILMAKLHIMKLTDLKVRSHAANALPKLAAIDEDSRRLALGSPDRCMQACAATMASLLRDEAQAQAAHDTEELFRSYKMQLMNVCVETLSYLWLHFETKQA